MKRKQLRITGILLTICMILGTIFPVLAEAENTSLEISAASGILMEVETGKSFMKRTVIPEEVRRASQKS